VSSEEENDMGWEITLTFANGKQINLVPPAIVLSVVLGVLKLLGIVAISWVEVVLPIIVVVAVSILVVLYMLTFHPGEVKWTWWRQKNK
jgi:hypothetical protein